MQKKKKLSVAVELFGWVTAQERHGRIEESWEGEESKKMAVGLKKCS
jgi:hypothetical protein